MRPVYGTARAVRAIMPGEGRTGGGLRRRGTARNAQVSEEVRLIRAVELGYVGRYYAVSGDHHAGCLLSVSVCVWCFYCLAGGVLQGLCVASPRMVPTIQRDVNTLLSGSVGSLPVSIDFPANGQQ